MIFVYFTFQIIYLAIGFGIGYLLLLTANRQEKGLKYVGIVLGWVLIILSLVNALIVSFT